MIVARVNIVMVTSRILHDGSRRSSSSRIDGTTLARFFVLWRGNRILHCRIQHIFWRLVMHRRQRNFHGSINSSCIVRMFWMLLVVMLVYSIMRIFLIVRSCPCAAMQDSNGFVRVHHAGGIVGCIVVVVCSQPRQYVILLFLVVGFRLLRLKEGMPRKESEPVCLAECFGRQWQKKQYGEKELGKQKKQCPGACLG
jgi:hypothetical protein